MHIAQRVVSEGSSRGGNDSHRGSFKLPTRVGNMLCAENYLFCRTLLTLSPNPKPSS